MKRHPSLAPLSRDHHGALILARLLQKNAPAYKNLPHDVKGKAEYAFKFYNDELIKHFEQEEEILKGVKGIDDKMDKVINDIFLEHQQLHLFFGNIQGQTELQDHLHETGICLEKHIRKEERELFPMMQELCSEDQLSAIENILSTG